MSALNRHKWSVSQLALVRVRRVVNDGSGETDGNLVVGADEMHQLSALVGGRSEDARSADVALDLGESELDLNEPRAARQGVADREVWTCGASRLNGEDYVSRQVVADHMDLPSRALRGARAIEERHKCFTGLPGDGTLLDVTSANFERLVEGHVRYSLV